MASKEELIIMALQQRIGEMAAQHELEKAILRAELTQNEEAKKEKEKAIIDYNEKLENLVSKES